VGYNSVADNSGLMFIRFLSRSSCFPDLRNNVKFREHSNLQQFSVIQGHRP